MSQTLANECVRCGALSQHSWFVVDAGGVPLEIDAVRTGEGVCSACGATSELQGWQAIVNLSAEDPRPCVVVVGGLHDEGFDREEARRKAAIGVGQWSESTGAVDEWNFLLVDRTDWSDFLQVVVGGTFSWRRPDSWKPFPPTLKYELARAFFAQCAQEWLVEVIGQLREGARDTLATAVQQLAANLSFQSVVNGVRAWLRPGLLLLGPSSVYGLLDRLVSDLGDGAEPGTALELLVQGTTTTGADLSAAIELFQNPGADPFDRVLVSRKLLNLLKFNGASAADRVDYWRGKTQMERELKVRGLRSAAMALGSAESWTSAAHETGDDKLIAEALAKHATLLLDEPGADVTAEVLSSCEAEFVASIELDPIDLEDESDQVRYGNLLQVRGLRTRLEESPDYRPLLKGLTQLLDHQADGRNRAHNAERRGSFGLNAALQDPPQASIDDVVGDLDEAIELSHRFKIDPRLVMMTLRDLALAWTQIARASKSEGGPACEKGLAAVVELLALNPGQSLRSLAYESAADLLLLAGRTDEASRQMDRALADCPPAQHGRRRILAMRLGCTLADSRDWPGSAVAFATACSEPDLSPTLADRVAAGDPFSWNPDRAARWASFAYAMAGNGPLAVEFLESALARQAALEVKIGAISDEDVRLLSAAFSADAADSSSPASSVGAIRVPFAWIAAQASTMHPVVYVNPNPVGTVVLIVAGPDHVEIEISEEITGATFGRWVIGDGQNLFRAGPGLKFEQNLTMISRILDQALPTFGDGLMRDLARALRRMNSSQVVMICAGYARSFPLQAVPYDCDGRAECLADWIDVVMAPCMSLTAAAKKLPVSNCFVGVADSDVSGFLPLDGARIEIAAASLRFDPNGRYEHYGQDASIAAIEHDTEEGCVLHLSVHTRGSDVKFVLADGDLAALDLPMRLGAVPRLVFAASCSSAAETSDGCVDEARQLGTAMLAAGCPATIVALWPVDDTATTLLVGRFYEHYLRDRLPPQTSLRLAAIWLRSLTGSDINRELAAIGQQFVEAGQSTRGRFAQMTQKIGDAVGRARRPFSNPTYWAPFQIFGSGSTTERER